MDETKRMIVVFRDLPFGGFDIIETVSIHTTHRNLCSTYVFFSQTRCNILYSSLLAALIVVAIVRKVLPNIYKSII